MIYYICARWKRKLLSYLRKSKKMIPKFDSNGNLPPGTYTATLTEVLNRFGLPGYSARLQRTKSLKAFVDLVSPYIQALYIDGSYITSNIAPHDVDIAIILKDDIPNMQNAMDAINLFKSQFKHELDVYPYKKGDPRLNKLIDVWTKDKSSNLNPKGIIFVEMDV
jgi:hypothetical protein